MAFPSFIEALLPKFCAGCQAPGEWICDNCVADFQRPTSVCPVCGDDLPTATPSHPCSECLKEQPPFDRHVSLVRLSEAVARLIHGFKYGGEFWSRAIFRQCLQQHSSDFSGCDLVVPVPLHVKRLRKRGYNQSWLLAQDAARVLHLEANHSILVRKRDTPTQTSLDRSMRAANVHGAFAVTDAKLLRDKTILLVDDVRTTGATLRSLAHVLRAAGAKTVRTLTFAQAPLTGFQEKTS
jgi:ComF family protein